MPARSPLLETESKYQSNWSNLRFLLKRHETAIGGLAGCSILSGLAEASLLAAIAQVAAALLSDTDSVKGSLGPLDISLSVGAMIAFAAVMGVLRLGLQAGIAYLGARTAGQVQADLRNSLTRAFTQASWEVQSRDGEGHLQEMLTSHVVQATMGTLQIASLVSALFTFIVLLIYAMLLNPVAASVVVAVAALLFLALRPLSATGQRRSKELSLAQMEFAGGVGEASRMAEETRVFGVGKAQQEQLEGLVANARRLFFRTQVVGRLIPSLYQGLIYLTVVGGLAALAFTGGGQMASLGAVVLLLVRAGTYGQQIQGSYQLARQSLPFVARLRDATDRYEADRPASGGHPLPLIETLSFSRVSFAYRPEQRVLVDVDFELPQREAVGIIGPSGAGKSTLVQLLLRLRRPVEGTYLVNGRPVEEWDIDDWHRQVAYVPQEPKMLHASVADNIRFRRNISQADVERAAKLARIHDDVVGWRDGYETLIGPRADSVSGGQQQRICLARALAARPTMLVLDEPTSALDPRSEALIRDSLGELADELFLFIVTHRMSALDVCDRVMVVDEHSIVDFDEPEVLARTSDYFGSAADVTSPAPAAGARQP
ncbi:MAG TPA: ABC transporter ATP-binding protein [Solirubrobacterales bacterium]|nr:ABC transporter ATP-binding protein [Solirubrobacterales bacterium]